MSDELNVCCPRCGHTHDASVQLRLANDLHARAAELERSLRAAGHRVSVGGLTNEAGAAAALGLSSGHLRNLACYGEAPVPPVLIARRRWYRLLDLAAQLQKTA